MIDWTQSKHFSREELECKETKECNIDPVFLAKINTLREKWGRPITVSSGYRSVNHSVEKNKKNGGGAHTTGRAIDILIFGRDAYKLLKLIMETQLFTGVGISQKGLMSARFIHIDDLEHSEKRPRPTLWSY